MVYYGYHKQKGIIMKARTQEEIFSELPLYCVTKSLMDKKTIILKRGMKGYYDAKAIGFHESADAYNKRNNITPAQIEAMQFGSMFGWNVPGADPLNHNERL